MSATSETAICNLALIRIGKTRITSLTEGTTAADLCDLLYPQCRDDLLRSHPWNFATKRVTLALSSTTPNHEFTHYHVLPVDCLKVRRTSWEAEGIDGEYRIETVNGVRVLACNEDTVRIEYTAQITDTAIFDASFTDCLAQRIAAELAMPLADNQSLARSLWEVYRGKLAEAMTTDAQEGTPRDVVDASGWATARL